MTRGRHHRLCLSPVPGITREGHPFYINLPKSGSSYYVLAVAFGSNARWLEFRFLEVF